jgi:hypothetical protein
MRRDFGPTYFHLSRSEKLASQRAVVVRATADALEAYQKSIGGEEAAAIEIRLRAERRRGQEIQAGQEGGEISMQT